MTITNSYIAKIEGHGSLDIDWNKEKVKLNIHEGERLFEGILVNREAEEAHWITPRICGVCPIAHNLASIRAIEDAYGIEVNETSKLLRKLMVCAQMIQSHALHLFFLVLPDYIGLDRGTDLAKKDPKAFGQALSLKTLGDDIAYAVAGRNVHPTATTVGGFHKIPTKETLEKLLKELEETEKAAIWTENLFSGLKYPELKVNLEMVALNDNTKEIVSNSSFSIGKNRHDRISIKDYKQNIEEELRDYSTAKFGKFQGKEMLIGSLSRLIIGSEKAPSKIDPTNPFHNILAQAIELFEYHKQAQDIIKTLIKIGMDAETVAGQNPTFKGIGAIEAPRGGLYHEIHLNEQGIITYANIITPTVQNLMSMEKSSMALLEQTQGKKQEEREHLIEMLIRAYDPCITCAVH